VTALRRSALSSSSSSSASVACETAWQWLRISSTASAAVVVVMAHSMARTTVGRSASLTYSSEKRSRSKTSRLCAGDSGSDVSEPTTGSSSARSTATTSR